jgi:hypothetical protein
MADLVTNAELGPSADDVEAVGRLLGRRPQGAFRVVVRTETGTPAVIENAPKMDSGRPMPTTYWLLDRVLKRRVGTLEAEGGVDAAEREIGLEAIAADHDRYRRLRDATVSRPVPVGSGLPDGPVEPQPSGGVGGTRVGVKCLHAHLAWWLVEGEDLVGQWTAQRLVDRWPLPHLLSSDGSKIRWPEGTRPRPNLGFDRWTPGGAE